MVYSLLHIRPLKKEDAPYLLELFRESVNISAAEQYTQEQREAWAPHDKTDGRWENLSDRTTFVAEIDDVIVGFADITHNGEIDHLYVDYRYQRRGIGAKLIQACEAAARKQGLQSIVTYANALAAPLFRKCGFQEIGEEYRERRGVQFCIMKMHKSL
jgi:putative acetyltransferase